MNKKRLPPSISDALEAGSTLVVPSTQRQAAIRVAWADEQRALGKSVWNTPRVVTLAQFFESALDDQWAETAATDRLMPSGAEWAALRELRRDAGGMPEARALLNSLRTLQEWRIPGAASGLSSSPEAELLAETATQLSRLSAAQGRKPLREWLAELRASTEKILATGFAVLPPLHAETLRRLGAELVATPAGAAAFSVAQAENDEHELDLIAQWCREQLERAPESRLLIVDARLRQRRGLYERLFSQTLTPSEWFGNSSRGPSTVFTFEGGRPLAEFPLIAHALLTLRLLTGRLRFEELVRWLRLPFLDQQDCFAGAAVETQLREARQLEFSATELVSLLERSGPDNPPAQSLANRLKLAAATLGGEARTPAEWAPRTLTALRQLGWHGTRTLRSDEQQTVARWHVLLDEYSALGAWLPRAPAGAAVSTLADLAAERNFDAASVEAPVTLTDSHDDPIVRYDGIWVAGLDAAQWPAPPRPDVFIPFGLQARAGIPAATAAGQTAVARVSLAAWRASATTLVCSWARLEGDAHRSPSPLLARSGAYNEHSANGRIQPLARATRSPAIELLEDEQGVPIDTTQPVGGGVRPLQLQAECAFRAYAELRLGARPLEAPTPGIDPRERGMLLHKALELVWGKLKGHFELTGTDEAVRKWMIGSAVEAAVVAVFRGYVPEELRLAVDREKFRLEQLIMALLEVESQRAAFEVVSLEARREVSIAGGRFEVRIDRVDSIEGGGFAILDYKSGEPRALRWQGDLVRDPQLIAYLLAESGRNVQALANVSLANGRAKFSGKSSRKGLLPDVNGLPGLSVHKNQPEEFDAAWRAQTAEWVQLVRELAAEYIAGNATVEPASDVCRLCALTTLCRRVELAAEPFADDTHD